MILDQYFKEYCLEQRSCNIKASSISKVKNVYKCHIQPFFKNKSFPFNIKDINDWKLYLLNKKLSDTYLINIYSILKAILNYVYRVYDIPNIMTRTKNFRRTTPEFVGSVYSIDEFKKYCSVIDDYNYLVFFMFLYFTGVRRGECLALEWGDFIGDYVIINKTLSKRVLGTPKTLSSYRKILLPPFLKEMILKIEPIKSSKRIFHFSETSIDRHNRIYSSRANLKRIRIHDFRHSDISYLTFYNFSIESICERTGHSDKSQVYNRYSHTLDEERKRIIDTMTKDFYTYINKKDYQ